MRKRMLTKVKNDNTKIYNILDTLNCVTVINILFCFRLLIT